MQRTCSVEGCEKPHLARGWCGMHWARWRKWGDPLRGSPTLTDRFWAKVQIDNPWDCWVWLGPRSRAYRYGAIGAGGTGGALLSAHRLSYQLLVGPIPAGMELDHLCYNRRCVNPLHLEPVTHLENLRRADVWYGIRTAKTHCPQGHLYDDANTYINQGRRGCRTCRLIRSRARVRRAFPTL